MKAHRAITVGLSMKPGKVRRLFEIASACRFVWNWAIRTNADEMDAVMLSRCSGGPGLPKPSTAFFSLCKRFTHLRRVEQQWLMVLP